MTELALSTRVRALAALVGILAILPATAHAQDNSAAVEALFAEGKRLVAEGKFPLACPKFLASYELEQRLGTLLNLADCYERNGQLASAFARYLEAKPHAERANQQERAEYAAQHAAALEPRLARLTIFVPARTAGLEVKRNGVLLDAKTYGVAVPIDVGNHRIVSSAPGKRAWAGEVTIAKDGERKIVHLPALYGERDVEGPSPPSVADGGITDDTPPPTEDRRGSNVRKPLGLAIAGVGVVSLVVGVAFGISALGEKSDSSKSCGQSGAGKNDCTGDGYDLRSSAVTDGNVSTIFFVAGTAALVGGLVLWLTAPSHKPDAVARLRAGLVF